MKKLISALFVAAALSSAAYAGQTVHNSVSVGDSSANGSTVGARNSGDAVQYILCKATARSRYSVAGCYAVDTAGNQAMCLTSDPGMVAAARSVSAASYISFKWERKTGACTEIAVANGSPYLD